MRPRSSALLLSACITILGALPVVALAGETRDAPTEAARRVAAEIRREALLPPNGPEGRPLPLASHWNVGTVRGTFAPDHQIGLLQDGHHILPWMSWPSGDPQSERFEAYYVRLLSFFAELELPVSFRGTQWNAMLVKRNYREGPEEQWAGVLAPDGTRVAKVSPFGPVEPWRDPAQEYVDTPAMKRAQEVYPEPPLVLWVSNNEPPDLRWSKHGPLEEVSGRYLERYGKGRSDEFKRRVVGEGWVERYRVMLNAMREALVHPTWKRNVRFVGYGAFGPAHLGRWDGWKVYSLICDRWTSPDWHCWDGGSPSYYTNNWSDNRDHWVFSTQVESMNWLFMLDEAWKANPSFWFEISTWDGNEVNRWMQGLGVDDPEALARASSRPLSPEAARDLDPALVKKSKALQYLKDGQDYPPERAAGWVQFGMWLVRPRVVREFRGHATPLVPVEPYWMETVRAVDRVWSDETLTGFWRHGRLVPNPAHRHPYQVDIPERYRDIHRWYLLDTDLDPPRPWEQQTDIPVFSLALVRGEPGDRRWLVYAHSPRQDRRGVTIDVPDYGEISVDVPRCGAFYLVEEEKRGVQPVASSASATYRNPVVEGVLADPAVILHEGVYYLYATGEVDGDNGTRVFTSRDLVHWKRGPVVFRPGPPHVWAPDVWRDPASGKFYLYYTVNQTVGVAEADGPLGPFEIRRKFFDRAIDAHLFADDDGKLYLYFVQLPGFRITVQPMAGPTETRGEPRVILEPEAPWEKRAGHVTEGPWMLKDRGRYHLIYSGSGANTPDYAVGYATSKSPLGPFERAGHNPIVQRSEGLYGPGHGCTIRDGAGHWWHVYHQKRTGRVEWGRFICIDPVWFDDEGRLRSRATRGTPQKAPTPQGSREKAGASAETSMPEAPPVRNGSVWHDTAGKEIWSNGGHMIREDGTFWWVGYDTGPGRPWKIRLYSSTDLATWKLEGTLIRKAGKFAQFGWAGRPALLHNRATGKYIIVFEADSPRQWERHQVGFAVADRIDGPYKLAGMEYPEGTRSTGDQSVYQEGDRAYLLATLDRDIDGKKYLNQSLAIFELSDDFLHVGRKLFEGFDNVNGNRAVVPRHQSSREASHIIKVQDTYYWFSSGLVGWNSSATLYATATSLSGPWSDLKLLRTDPPSPDSYNTQHDFIVPVTGSETTTWVYVGDRYSQWTRRGAGRNIFLPLVFTDTGPVLRWCREWTLDPVSGRWSEAPRG